MKIFTMNITGNLHKAAKVINEHGLADHLMQLNHVSRYNTVAVLRVSNELYKELEKRGVL